MSIVDSTSRYERWLGRQIDVVREDLDAKHELMADTAFVCFRGAYYRWLEHVSDIAPGLDAPVVAAVGDLHVENFGTWRDAEGRLVWGVNDFDQSEELPYTYDLARLAASALLAIREAKIKLEPTVAADAILAGYRKRLASGGRPIVLAGRHPRLARLVDAELPDPAGWWEETLGLPPASAVPESAREALQAVMPAGEWQYDLHTKASGVGSRGHRRLVLTGDCDGAPAARELKQLCPPAGQWLGRPQSEGAETRAGLVRSVDPIRVVRGGWVARRIAPDCVKLDLGEVGTRAGARRMLSWMGAETANVHLASADVTEVLADLKGRRRNWLQRAAGRLAVAARQDFKVWRRHVARA
jgi:hypothetical protein